MNQTNPVPLSHVLTIRLIAEEPLRSSMIDTLRGIVGPTEAHPRCRSVGIYLAVDDAEEITLVEEWKTLEAMTAHIRSREFRPVLAVIDLSKRAPEIRLDTVTSKEGIGPLAEMLAG